MFDSHSTSVVVEWMLSSFNGDSHCNGVLHICYMDTIVQTSSPYSWHPSLMNVSSCKSPKPCHNLQQDAISNFLGVLLPSMAWTAWNLSSHHCRSSLHVFKTAHTTWVLQMQENVCDAHMCRKHPVMAPFHLSVFFLMEFSHAIKPSYVRENFTHSHWKVNV